MEIRPYKSQVKSTPVISAAQETPDMTKGAKLQMWSGIVTESGKVAGQAVNAYERERLTNQLLGEQAAVQDIDFAVQDGLKEFQKYLDERAKDPNGVFYDDNRAADEVYSYQMIKAKENSVGKIKDPALRAKAEEYFNQLKLRAGADVELMIEQHKARAGAVVLGNAIARAEDSAISAQSQEEINGQLNLILKSLSDMEALKAITPEQAQAVFAASKQNINYGRAKNQVDALDYKTGQEFINKVDIDDESRKKLQTYFKDKWDRQKNVLEQELGQGYEDWMKAIEDGTATREGIMADTRLELHPELGMNTDYRKLFIGILDKRDAARQAEAERQEKERQSAEKAAQEQRRNERYDYFWQQIESGGDKEALRKQIIDDNLLDTKTDKERLIRFIDGKIDKEEAARKAGEKKQKKTGTAPQSTDGHMAEFYEIVLNPYASLKEKERQAAEFYAMYPDAIENLSKFNTMIQTSDKYANIQIKALQEDVDARIKALAGKPEQAQALIKASQSLFQVLAEDMWYKTVNGKKIETSEVERKAILDGAIEQVGILLKENDILSALAGFSASGNPAKFKATKDGYRMDIDSQYDDLKAVLKGVDFYRNTDEGQRVLVQIETTEKQAIQNATGTSLDYYTFKVVDGKAYYVSPNKDKIYYIDKNDKDRWNIYVDTGRGAEIVTPQIIKREEDLPKPTPAPKNTEDEVKKIEQAWENSPDWWKENPMVRYEYENRNK